MSVASIFSSILRKNLAKSGLNGMFRVLSRKIGLFEMDMFPDSYSLGVYISVFFGPFVQEDTAVFLAAGLAANGVRQTIPLFFTILLGLFLSDIWKYWIGWAALKNTKAQAYAQREQVITMAEKVQSNLMKTLLIGRFVPLARVPTYVACGYLKITYWKFCLGIAFTAILYVLAVFTLVHFLGQVLGERLKWVLPITSLAILAIVALIFCIKRFRAASK